MQKKYEKPLIVIEKFSLSTSIASNCEGIVGNPSRGSCAVIGTGNIYMFNSSVSECDYTPGDMGGEDDKWDGFCYHVPTEYNNLFNS